MSYQAPQRDMQFVIHELFDFESHYKKLNYEGVDQSLINAIVAESAKFCEEQLVPLNAVGDEVGCTFSEGEVTTPPGFKQAYTRYQQNEWPSLSGPVEYGGQGLPDSLRYITMEITISANHAWSNYPGLTGGAITTLVAHAPASMKDDFLSPMIKGDWSGTMCLTEPQCGSDLGLIATTATPVEGGDSLTYQLTGTKMFISSGEHDLTENIVHIVLARIKGAPSGVKGLSLFLVPKFNVKNGKIGERNQVACGSIESKMGIHGSATCVMNFDGATAYLIGEENKGMSTMFSFINESRLGVAMHGHCHSEASFQKALAYAKERKQMKAFPRRLPHSSADPIIAHADIRRMLMTQKAFAEGGRMLNYYCAQLVDIMQDGAEPEQAKQLLSVLTPIVKGFLTEVSLEATNYGIQILGGHGYITEWGLEQELRDTRITTIYEGTTVIQGLDLLVRKIFSSSGTILDPLKEEIETFIKDNSGNKYVCQLSDYFVQWIDLTWWIADAAAKDPNEVNGAAVEYIHFSGYVLLAYFWAQASVVAESKIVSSVSDNSFYKAKLSTCHFYFQRILPRLLSIEASIRNGCSSVMALADDEFMF